ncbi:MAG: restriction endonuclease subunit S [Pseudanabaena sp.]
MSVPKLRFPDFRDAGEWEEYALADIALEKLSNGVFNDPNKVGKGYKLVNVLDMYIESYIDETKLSLADISDTEFKKNKVENGDIFFTRSSLVKEGIAKSNIYLGNAHDITFDGHLIRLRPNKNITLPLFLHFGLRSEAVRSQLVAKGKTATMTTIGQSDIADTKILIAKKIEEQQKIADCLTSLDDRITLETQKLDTLKAHKKGLMQQLFPAEGETLPKLRFPEFLDAGEWEEKKLIDVTDKKIKWSFIGGPFGSNLKSSDYTPHGIRVIQLQNIGDAEFLDNYKIFTSEQKANELLSCNIYPNEIILSKMGDPVGRACLIPNKHERYLMCSDGIRLVVDEQLFSKYFIYSLINSDSFRKLLDKTATGSTRKRIGLDDLKNLPMVLPSFPEQQKIAGCLTSIDEAIAAQSQAIDLLKLHKKGLMQQLFPSVEEVNR